MIIDGKVLVSDINDMFGLDLDDTNIDTIGGWILSKDVDAVKGTVIQYDQYQFTVVKMEGHQIKEIAVNKIDKKKAAKETND
jgi:CBS domain containing-hemolysin-like protein